MDQNFCFEHNTHTLVLIDMQKGFLDQSHWGERNNPSLEENIKGLLKFYRQHKLNIIHIQHLSTEEHSPLRPGQPEVEFMPNLGPTLGERIFQKSVNSAFIGTELEKYLILKQIESLILVGLTSDHCVSTTARMGSNLGFHVIVASNCTATFNRKIGSIEFSAELVHDVSLASLRGEFAEILTSNDIQARIIKNSEFTLTS